MPAVGRPWPSGDDDGVDGDSVDDGDSVTMSTAHCAQVAGDLRIILLMKRRTTWVKKKFESFSNEDNADAVLRFQFTTNTNTQTNTNTKPGLSD